MSERSWSVAALRRSSTLQRHPHRTVPRGLEARIHHLLRFQRPHRPVVVELAGKNLAGEVAEHDGVLRGCVAKFSRVGNGYWRLNAGNRRAANFRPVDLKGRLTAVERVDENGRPHPTVHAADKNPLLLGGEKRRVKSRRNTVVENKFGGKFVGGGLTTAGGFVLRENPACDRVRQLPFH